MKEVLVRAVLSFKWPCKLCWIGYKLTAFLDMYLWQAVEEIYNAG